MIVIDGNNLWYEAMTQPEPMAGIGRPDLLILLDEFARSTDEPVLVVLDGPGTNQPPADGGARRLYSGSHSADDLIIRLVAESAAPRRLTVVSSDRELVRAVRRRRVRTVSAARFAGRLAKWLAQPRRRQPEPAAKHLGLGGTSESVRQWLQFFGIASRGGPADIMIGDDAGSPVAGTEPATGRAAPRGDADTSPELGSGLDAWIERAYHNVEPLKDRRRPIGRSRRRT